MTEHAPAFQFYPKDFLSDSNVIAMPAEVVGAYILLLSTLWLETRLPMRVPYLSRIARVNEDRFQEIWDQYFVDCFQLNDGFITHKRLDAERKKQKDRRESQSKGGKQGANARWGDKIATPMGNPLATPMGSDGFSSSFSFSSKDSRQSPSAPPPIGGTAGEGREDAPDLETAKRNSDTAPRPPIEAMALAWNALPSPVPKIRLPLTKARAAKVRLRWGDPAFRAAWPELLAAVPRTPFLLGQGSRGWKITWDWVFSNDANILKAVEGNYAHTESVSPPTPQHRELPDMSGKTMGER